MTNKVQVFIHQLIRSKYSWRLATSGGQIHLYRSHLLRLVCWSRLFSCWRWNSFAAKHISVVQCLVFKESYCFTIRFYAFSRSATQEPALSTAAPENFWTKIISTCRAQTGVVLERLDANSWIFLNSCLRCCQTSSGAVFEKINVAMNSRPRLHVYDVHSLQYFWFCYFEHLIAVLP